MQLFQRIRALVYYNFSALEFHCVSALERQSIDLREDQFHLGFFFEFLIFWTTPKIRENARNKFFFIHLENGAEFWRHNFCPIDATNLDRTDPVRNVARSFSPSPMSRILFLHCIAKRSAVSLQLACSWRV